MKKVFKIGGILLLTILALTLFVLRLTGLEPQDPGWSQLAQQHEIARPGLWLRGEVVRTPVTDWSFVKNSNFGQGPTVEIETRTPYFIPHSVRAAAIVRNGQLYIPSHQGCGGGLHGAACDVYNGPHGVNPIGVPFPKNKFWTANVMRDPRVRLKINGKLYEATLVLITDPAEAAAILGRETETTEKGADGQQHTIGYTHLFRVFQRNVSEARKTEQS
jgi:hypothetical protein